jgi:agmatinase
LKEDEKAQTDTIINCKPKDAQVLLLCAPYDLTSSYGKGADKAPRRIITTLDDQIERYERLTGTNPNTELNISYQFIRGISETHPEKMVEKVSRAFERSYSTKEFVILLGGEHSVTNGPLRALSESMTPSEITVFQIDAHLDLRPDDSDYNPEPWGRYAHSAVMRRAFDLGYQIVNVGARAYHGTLEYGFAKQNHPRIKFFEWGKFEHGNTDTDDHFTPPRIEDIISSIRTHDVYLTIDVDGFDPAHMPATGTPVQCGLDWHYSKRMLQELFARKRVIAADIVEVAPALEGGPRTVYNAAELLYYTIALHSAKNRRRTE